MLLDKLTEFHEAKDHKATTKRLIRASVRHYQRLGFTTLDTASLTKYRDARLREGRSPATVRGELNKLLAYARWHGIEPVVKLPRNVHRAPVAWSRFQIAKLFRTARRTKRVVYGIPGNIFWPALLGTAYDSGERIGAVCLTTWNRIDWESSSILYLAEIRKGGYRDAVGSLSKETLKSLAKLREFDHNVAEEDLIFGLGCKSTLWKAYARLLADAGLPCDRRSKFHRLRRTHATEIHFAGGDATAALGHSSDAITRASYIDPRGGKHRLPWRPTRWLGWLGL